MSDYDLGTAYGHIALGVDDVAETCERIRKAGGNITREPGPVKGGNTVIAFVEDPDGYKVELIETGSREPLNARFAGPRWPDPGTGGESRPKRPGVGPA